MPLPLIFFKFSLQKKGAKGTPLRPLRPEHVTVSFKSDYRQIKTHLVTKSF